MKDQLGLDRALFDTLQHEQMGLMGLVTKRPSADETARRVASLLNQGANPDTKDKTGFSVLMLAANNENSRAVALLLQKGAKVNVTDRKGWTALMYAATYGLSEGDVSKRRPIIEVMALLLKYKANPNVADKYGQTPLILTAGYAQCAECVRLLLRHGARINPRTESNYTALGYAKRRSEDGPDRDNHEVIAVLKKAGARE